MNKVTIEITINETLRDKVESVLENLDLTIPEALELFLKDIAKTDKLPFSLSESKPVSKEELIRKIEQELGNKPLEVVDY